MPRYLGQHFLINKSAVKKIIAALELESGDTIIEIGPGHGELTQKLKTENLKLKIVGIEKDHALAKNLQKSFVRDKNIEIIEGDALKVLPKITDNLQLITHNYKLVGNIPYYITGHLLRIIGELQNKPSLIVLTIQKEVARRICAKVGEMSLLAASIQFWAEPKIIATLKPKDFSPAPKVNSAVIKLKTKNFPPKADQPRAEKLKTEDIKNYYQLIKIAFKQPRKTLLNNLLKGLTTNNLQLITKQTDKEQLLKMLKKMGYSETSRPQDLTVENLLNLSKTL